MDVVQVQDQEIQTDKEQDQETTPTGIDIEIPATIPKTGGKKKQEGNSADKTKLTNASPEPDDPLLPTGEKKKQP